MRVELPAVAAVVVAVVAVKEERGQPHLGVAEPRVALQLVEERDEVPEIPAESVQGGDTRS